MGMGSLDTSKALVASVRICVAWVVALLVALAFVACDIDMKAPDAAGGGGATADAGSGNSFSIELEPNSSLLAAPALLRIHLASADKPLNPLHVALVTGDLKTTQLREIAKGSPSLALSKRIVAAAAYAEGDGGVAVVPAIPLVSGATYSLGLGDLLEQATITVGSAEPTRMLRRIWPPEGGSATVGYGVWCGDEPVPLVDEQVRLPPSGLEGRIRRGAVSGGAGGHCARFEAVPGHASTTEAVPPMTIPSTDLVLDPRPLRREVSLAPIVALDCDADEVPFGPGCVRLQGDRLEGRSPDAPVLWAVAGAGVDTVFASAPKDVFVVGRLPPSMDITLDVAAIDNGGNVTRASFAATTGAPTPHLVINEVMANPLGPEPAEEWIELVNDGTAPASLDGYALSIGGGMTTLPAMTVAEREFVLVVSSAFTGNDGIDPSPKPGTRLVRVSKLGKRGLSNSGQEIMLVDSKSTSVSRFPAVPKPKEGKSVARRSPQAPDSMTNAFYCATPTPGSSNEE